VVASATAELLAEQIGDATITLQSHTYYKDSDLTRFVYRVVSPQDRDSARWVLGAGGCISEEQVDVATMAHVVSIDVKPGQSLSQVGDGIHIIAMVRRSSCGARAVIRDLRSKGVGYGGS
jgi:hypothetical protein